jgi:tRNA-specific 2-thiouridylase
MSGGVDSSTVAARLVAQGHEVIGMTMRLWTGGTGRCCGMDDVHDARRVAATLGIPFYVVDLEQAFRRAVVDEFCHSYGRGETPSPCIRCNQFIKFDLLLQRARELGAVLATGHYVVRRAVGERFELWRARDPQKDQSYFLFTLTQSQLADLLFPLGDSFKHETRSMAASHGLHISDKRDSQDICFVPSDGGPRPDYRRFIDQYLPGTLREGEIVEQGSGRVLGHHRGIAGYTIGQRHGLGISTGPEPWYVLALDVPANRLIVGRAAALYRDTLHVRQLHWIAGHAPVLGTPIQARIR